MTKNQNNKKLERKVDNKRNKIIGRDFFLRIVRTININNCRLIFLKQNICKTKFTKNAYKMKEI